MSKISIEVSLPQDNTYTELLRFYCQTCEADDPTLAFMSSMWSYAHHKGHLTGKQATSANAYIDHRLKKLNIIETEDGTYENLSMEK